MPTHLLAPAARSSSAWHRAQQRMAPYLFISPFLLLFAVFGAWPILKSLSLSLYATNGPKDTVFVGAKNFAFLFSDPDFAIAVKNTVVFAFWSVVLQIPLALGLALLLSQKWVRGRALFRLAVFAPYLIGQVFVGVLFSVLLVPRDGLLNRALHTTIGLPLDTKWLDNPALVMPALILAGVWLYTGLHMIYLLAALQAVDSELLDAALVDGANGPQRFWAVTLPAIRPVLIYVFILSTIGSFQMFELPYIMLNSTPGPNNSGLTVVMYLYQNGFVSGDLGYASAVGWTLALGILLISLVQLRATGGFKAGDA
jgi:ABC-type sugar transport system permease subunit